MQSSKRSGLILAGLTLALAGCEPLAPPGDPSNALTTPPHKDGGHAGPPSISTPVPPVNPSPVPEMPSTAKGDMTRKDEARPAEKKAEEPAKAETPK